MLVLKVWNDFEGVEKKSLAENGFPGFKSSKIEENQRQMRKFRKIWANFWENWEKSGKLE